MVMDFATQKLRLCLLLITVFASQFYAASLHDYRSRVESAQKQLDEIADILRDGNHRSGDNAYVGQAVAEIRRSLPKSEKVEFQGTYVNTINLWLHDQLDALQREYQQQKQLEIVSTISERLSAIATEIRDLEAVTASGRTKDEDKQKLAEILRREEFQKPQEKEESVFQRWMREFLEWLREKFPRANIDPQVPTGLGPLSVVLQFIVYALVIALVGFLIYKFAPVIIARFAKREKSENKSRVILGEHIEASASASDLFSEAETLARSGDLRGAIRKGYIALLCDLADKKVIGLARHKTNRDYLRDVYKRSSLFAHMKRATGSFERHWYGFRSPSSDDWDEFREQYRAAVNAVV
jgi:hypothetical protein